MIMNLGSLKLKLVIIFFFLSLSLNADPIEGHIVEIQILDKITAKVENIQIKVNDSFKYGTMNIEIYSCYKNPPEKIPENYVLLKIYDKVKQKIEKLIYQGWMISSSPSSTPLEHPVYDLWLKSCKIESDF